MLRDSGKLKKRQEIRAIVVSFGSMYVFHIQVIMRKKASNSLFPTRNNWEVEVVGAATGGPNPNEEISISDSISSLKNPSL